MSLNKQTLINQATPDTYISALQVKNPSLYQALQNLGAATKTIINTVIPNTPLLQFRESFIISGNPSVANDVLSYWYHVIMPIDVNSNWTYNSISLSACYITAKVEGAHSVFVADIKVSQQKGTQPFKSIFKFAGGGNPTLPPNTRFRNASVFSIPSLYQDDLLRVDVLQTDSSISGIVLDLIGNYQVTEN